MAKIDKTSAQAGKRTTKPPRVRLDPEARKGLMVQATLRCLRREGFQGTSVRKIAAESGGSIGLINHHYAGKDDLVAQSYRHLNQRIMRHLQEVVQAARDDPRARLSAYFSALFSAEMLNPELLETWLAVWSGARAVPVINAERNAAYRAQRTLVAGCLADLGTQRGWKRFDSGEASIALCALLDGLWLEASLNPEVLTHAQGVRLAESWLDGLVLGAYKSFIPQKTGHSGR